MKWGPISTRPREPASGPPGKRCYVVGDIHGRLDLLHRMLELIEEHVEVSAPADISIVTLGDYVDRGPHSKEVLDLLIKPPRLPGRLVCLQGNHEEVMLRALTGETELIETWLGLGGEACARSYGCEPGALTGRSGTDLEARLLNRIPVSHLDFIRSLPISARFGDYFLVHAGVRPGVALDCQSPQDMRWIREPFLRSGKSFGSVVVHGHSTSADVQHLPNRIGIDTGAWRTGRLTCLWIDGPKTGYLVATDQV